ncbi:tyrosinase family oxidase copper chaperone [Streptomyces sp. NPDC059168]|uniref:tyrosinase family oxidase copper chaperone n=1 Tax=Streptomyces sp. NPDC059168 TaxID=3346753 RepID=UPI0036BBC0A5
MVVGAGGVAVGADQQAAAGGRGVSRREAARALLGTGAALALAPVVAASRPLPTGHGPGGGSFDETYRGRRIQGAQVPIAGRRKAEGDWEVTVDGHPLHLMRRADGTWLSMVDHYGSYPTALEATRAAVDQIGPGQQLRDLAPGPVVGEMAGHHTGGRHGVRA